MEVMSDAQLVGVTRDQLQRRELSLPGRDILLADGRKLREILGYKEHLLHGMPGLAKTAQAMVVARGWHHAPTRLVVSASKGLSARFNKLLHVSVSYPDRDPSWEEIKMVRAAFFPADLDAVMILPRDGNYVNAHEHCFHLWQMPLEWTLG